MSNANVNYNEMILKNYQKTYPNLAEFSYDQANDCLVYEGNFVKLNGYGLSRIDPVFFNMNPEDIFIYFKNGFYQMANKNAQIQEYLNQLIITEDEEQTIKNYVDQYIDKLNIYARNAQFFDKYYQNQSVKDFISDLMAAKKIVEESRKLATPNTYDAYKMIASAYDNQMASTNKQQASSLGNEMVLRRTKSEFAGYSEFDKNLAYLDKLNRKDKLGMSGFTSIVLIISSAVTFGMYLALKLLG